MMSIQPGLFGLTRSNRDSQIDSWGKNQFNNSFPTSLACYMHFHKFEAVYLTLDALKVKHEKIDFSEIFGINPALTDLFFAFSNAVPVKLAEYVAQCLLQYIQLGECLKNSDQLATQLCLPV